MNHYMMLHVHEDGTDVPTLVDVANDFVREKENRKQLFEKFSASDIPNKFSISSKSTQTEIRDKNKMVVDKCSDLTGCQEVRFNRRTEAGGGESSRGPLAQPPQLFYVCSGPHRHVGLSNMFSHVGVILSYIL